MKWLWIIPLMVIGFAPVAFGQVVETKGQNYDLIEDFTIGEAKWTSHPERINNNGWQNYFLQTENQKIIFRSNAVGGFIYDIPSCSYSLYENGYDGSLIIPSVSSVATYLKDGTWQNMAVNEESCDVNFSQNENGIFLTSTKIMFRETNEPLFQSYNGTDSTIFLNGTSYDVINNGNQTGYYVDNFVQFETEKFTHEIKVDIFGGVKETFKVWNESDEQLGISQTVHTGETITVGENTIDIAQFNGQSFDRQFLEDNQARIFEIANGLNYDFDLGFESLTGINIISESSIFDTTYKVNLDYSNGGFVNYLEIDPTFTASQSDAGSMFSSGSSSTTCAGYNFFRTGNSATTGYSSWKKQQTTDTGNGGCVVYAVDYDLTNLSIGGGEITSVYWKNTDSLGTNPSYNTCDILVHSTNNRATQYADSISYTGNANAQVLANDFTCESGGTQGFQYNVPFDSSAYSIVENAQGSSLYTTIAFDDYTRDSVTHASYVTWNTNTLEISYTLPTAPQPPTNLQTVDGQPIELSWTAPVDDGGSSITGYKVFRTLNEFAMTELPNNGGTTGVDFTDNELLLHGFETVSATPTYTADLSTSSWTTGGTGTQVTIDTTNEEIDFSVPSTNSHLAQAYYDLTTVSDTNWIIRSQLDIDTVTQGSAVNDVFFSYGIGSINSNVNDSQDFLGLMIRVDDTKTDIFAVETDGSAPNNETTTLFTRQAQAETLYVELKRDSATSFTINLYSDSGYSTLLESKTITIPSSLTGLRYIKVTSIQGFSDSELIGSVSNIKFYNDMTTTTEDIIPDKSTNNISVTANAGTSTTGVIGNGIQAPDLTFTDSNLPDGTDSFTVGGWVQQTATPTNTKLLGFNDVTFNVGTTSADIKKSSTSPIVWDSTTATGITISGSTVTGNANAWNNVGSIDTVSLGESIDWTTSGTYNHVGLNTNANGGYTSSSFDLYANNGGFEAYESGTYYAVSGSYVNGDTLSLVVDSSGTVKAYKNGGLIHTYSGTASGNYYVVASPRLNDSVTVTVNSNTPIISATGLTDNTSTPQHYSFSRSGNDFTIYQNGQSVATATDSIDLGTISGAHTIKLDGTIDEYFIDSTALTSTEIDAIYNMGLEPTQVGTSTTTSFDDSNVSGGNTYYYYAKATNAIGDSAFSAKTSGMAGTPPNPPTGLTANIQDPNNAPLDIYLQWSSPTNVGTGTLSGFEVWRDGSLVTTTGLVTSYTDTVPSSGTYSYEIKAVSTHGTSGSSNSASQSTPTVPSAITDLSATVDSDTQISLSWSAPTNGGSAITGYKVFQDGVQIATPTSASHVVTGLTSNTQYTFKVIAVNNVGDSADSNLVTPTTYETIVGSINVSSTVQGATVKFDFSANVTSGSPTPNFNTFTLKEGATVLASNISTPYYYALPDISSHNYTITSTDNTHWNTPTISGTASNIVAGYVPNWENSVSYNYTRTSTTMNLFVNQDRQDLWDLTCNYRTTAQIIGNNNGVNGTMTNDWYYSDAQSISDADTVYVECRDVTGIILSFTSYNTNRIGAGISLLDNTFSEWTGTPVALVFVLLVAGLFSGRSAPAGILLVLAIVGVMGFIGLLVIDELIWAFILLAGILGLFMGKRFL